MKLILLALACAAYAAAQTCSAPSSIPVTGPLNDLAGPMTGAITLQMNYTISGANSIVQSQLQVPVSGGVLSVCLPPGALIVANYSVQNSAPMTGVTKFTRYWMVPSVGGPYTVSAVECTISLAGCGVITYFAVPSWGTMTPAQWSNLTPVIWGNLHP